MLYITRSRIKESIKASQLPEINKLIDTEIIPAVEKVDGVRSVTAYNSITGELTIVLNIENLATIDRVTADARCRASLGKWSDYTVRTGGEVLYDRAVWQGLYGKAAPRKKTAAKQKQS